MYNNDMTAEEKIRWHLLHDCACGNLGDDDFSEPANHYTWCPLRNPDDEAWEYFSLYDCMPS